MHFVRNLLATLIIILGILAPGQATTTQDQLLQTGWELYTYDSEQGPALLAVLWLTPEQEYHAYAHDPGELGKPTDLAAALVTGPEPGPDDTPLAVAYPPGHSEPDIFDPSKMVNVYAGKTPLFVLVGQDNEEGRALRIRAELNLLLCSDQRCVPLRAFLEQTWDSPDLNTLPKAEEQEWAPLLAQAMEAGTSAILPGLKPEDDAAVDNGGAGPGLTPALSLNDPTGDLNSSLKLLPGPEEKRLRSLTVEPQYFQPGLEVGGLAKAVLFALLAGFILNFLPCVLPVVSLKISTLVAASGEEDEKKRVALFREHNFYFSLGVLVFFLVLSMVLAFMNLAWGQLFQRPAVVLVLASVVFALGLSLFGLWTLPVIDLKAPRGATKNAKLGALFTGMLATVLATPCSGPFLGGVLGWALLRPPQTVALVFFCIGLGMAAPYLLMTAMPGLVRFFPKPGAWTGFMERIVGFFLMATTVYLLNILPERLLLPGLILLLSIAFGAWIWGQWTNLAHSAPRRWFTRGAAAALVAATALLLFLYSPQKAEWQAFNEQDFMHILGERPILIDFTADWCPNCKVLEKTTLSTENLAKWRKKYGLTLIQADLTEKNPDAELLLSNLGSKSIPVVAIFPAGDDSGKPLVLRDLFTTGQMERALEQVFGEQ